jgi:hypothetical protein
MDYGTFLDDQRTIDAIIRNFEIIGEASGRVSENLKEAYPLVEWRLMAGVGTIAGAVCIGAYIQDLQLGRGKNNLTMGNSILKLNKNRWFIIVRFVLFACVILCQKYIGPDLALFFVIILLIWSIGNFIVQKKNQPPGS